jgi:autotransporter-associated beta strand protein
MLTLSHADSYTGGTVVSAGTLRTTVDGALAGGSLTASAAVSIGSNETITSLSGNSGSLSIAAGKTLTVNQSGPTTYAGATSLAGKLATTGSGTLTLTGAQSLGAGTVLSVGGTNGTVQIGAGATGSVAAGAVVTVASSATLELDGAVSPLVDPTANITAGGDSHPTQRATVKNAGTLSIVSTGANQFQEVGGIDPNGAVAGNVVVNNNANLIADHIVQSSLTIGNGATFTLAPSDSTGNAAAGLVLAGSLTQSSSFVDGSGLLSAGGDAGSAPVLSISATGGANASAVPEPSAVVLLVLAGLSALALRRRHA